MKTFPSRAAAAATGAALVLTLAACSGGGGGEGGSKAGDDKEQPMGPLDEFFEEMYGDYDEETSNAQMREVEEITAECMSEQGFEYTPVDWSSQMEMGSSDELEFEWGTIEFAKEYGYGVTTNPWGETEEAPADGEAEEEFVDPNQERVEAMTETERAAYELALYGEMTEPVEGEEYEYDWETAGCSGKAQHEVYENTGMDEDKFTSLQDEMNAMWEASAADPRLTELNGEWSSCMADAGYPNLAAIGDAENAFYDETNALWENAYPTEGAEEMTAEDYEAIEESIQGELAKITPREIETATADFTCREEVDYDKVQQEVSFEYQQEFVDAHREELDAWLEAYQASQS